MTNFARLVDWQLVRRLDNWKVWILIAYIGLLATGIWAYTNQKATTSVIAQRKADIAANAAAEYASCTRSIPILIKFRHFTRGVNEVYEVLVENAVASHQATPPGTPVFKAQIYNLTRLKDGVRSVKGLSIPVPTMAQCKAQRDRLEARK